MSLSIKNKRSTQSGQALIIILLAMSVALTLVLSSVSRSVSDIEISDTEEESLRAFSAAEAGVEKALLEFTQTGGFIGETGSLTGQTQTDTEYTANITSTSVGSTYEHPKEIGPGEGATFWMTARDENGDFTCEGDSCVRGSNIKICFGDSTKSYPKIPAIEVQTYFDDSATSPGDTPDAMETNDFSNVKMDIKVFDPWDFRRSENNFGGATLGCNIDGFNSQYKYRIQNNIVINSIGGCQNNRSCLIAMKIRSLYTDDKMPIIISVSGAQPDLPAQGVVIDSVGTSGESARKLNVEYTFSSIPGIFNNTAFSEGGLVK